MIINYILTFIAGGGSTALLFAVFTAIFKRKKPKRQEVEAPKPIIKVIDCGTELLKAKVSVPQERLVTGWNTEIVGCQDRELEFAAEKLKYLLAEQLGEFMEIRQTRNEIDFAIDIEAAVRVVRKPAAIRRVGE